ncbi:MAG TPA: SDR family NAD(P)-dependent oxidoreductase [Turneriella sp.]|nr:SDR family NAD(P)-dependent oxidoreductase [Turneriella sp.]HNN01221.1 SDR family NAD(P)-dependent oxidoreductase [Turneriella sp.]
MHIFLTGASTGIGNAIARELDKFYKGEAKFSLVSRNKELLDALASNLQSPAKVFPCDLGQPQKALETLAQATQQNGPVDLLINNAGMQFVDHFTSISEADAARAMDLNYTTPTALMRSVLPAMASRNSGVVVNIASLAAITPTPYMAEYAASKAALAALSTALTGEYKDTAVHFLTVYPGPVKTPMAEKAQEKYSGSAAQNVPYGTAEELAAEIRKAIQNKKKKLVYPALYRSAEYFRDFAIWMTAEFAPKPK